jgi:hypothetical protein
MNMHSTKVEKRTYRVPGGGKRILTGVLLFASCLLILAGLLRGNGVGGLLVETKPTATPTVFSTAFDETPASREITLEARSWYAIQLGSFENEQSAKTQAQSYTARGAAGYVRNDGGRFRVLAALYPLKEDAQSVREQLRAQHEIDSYVYEISLPVIKFDVKGMAGQLDALDAAMQYLNTAMEKFCSISVSLDKRDLNMEQQLTALNEVSSQADTLRTVLSQRLNAPGYKVVGDLTGLLSQISQACKTVTDASAQGSVAMATQMKYQTLSLLTAVETYRNTAWK